MRIHLSTLLLMLLLPGCGPQSVGSLVDPDAPATTEPSTDDADFGDAAATSTGEPPSLGNDTTSASTSTTSTTSTTDPSTGDTTGTTGECEDCTAALKVRSGGNFTCALAATGSLRCWGLGSHGALGLGSTENIGDDELPSVAPSVSVHPVEHVVDFVTGGGGSVACVLLSDQGIRCWGQDLEFSGILGRMDPATIGDDETPDVLAPIELGGPVTQLTLGANHACALIQGGTVRCWGSNTSGALGYGHTNNIGDDETPASAGAVDVGDTVVAIDAGGTHTCVLLPGGRVRCWGNGALGQLGHGDVDPDAPLESSWIGDDETPASIGDIPIGGHVVQLATGKAHTCALLDTGAVRCWGSNNYGALGHNLDNYDNIGDDETPAEIGDVPLGTAAIQVSAGWQSSCALLDTGAVRCWGLNMHGQLGRGHDVDSTAVDAPDIDLGGPATAIDTSNEASCAVLADQTLRCWGRNFWGELGYGHTNDIGDDETPASAGPIVLGL